MELEDFERLLDDLVEAGVFEESADGHLRPTDGFERDRAERRTRAAGLSDSEYEATLDEYGADGTEPSEVDPSVLGDAMAIYESVEHVDRERSFLAAEALARTDDSESASEVPEGFVAIEGRDIERFMRAHPAAILYFWREECDPCDGVRESLETLLAEGKIPESVGLGAVYGPDSAELIRQEYDVGVAPTILFCKDGRVDSRIIGDSGHEAIRLEVEIITEGLD